MENKLITTDGLWYKIKNFFKKFLFYKKNKLKISNENSNNNLPNSNFKNSIRNKFSEENMKQDKDIMILNSFIAKAKQKAKLATNSSEEQQKLLAEVLEKAQNEGGFDDEATLNAYQTLLAERENELGGTPTYDNEEELLKSQLSALANLNIRA